MNVRTKENCDKYRECKKFVDEYEKSYKGILHKPHPIFDNFVWDNRYHIVNNREYLKKFPGFTHLHKHIAEYQRQNIESLGIKYLGWLPF